MNHRIEEIRAVARFLLARIREDSLDQAAGSLTFTTLFSLVPLVTIVVTVFDALPLSRRLVSALHSFVVSNFVPGPATKLITASTQQFAENASHLTAIGIAMLAVTAIMLMMTIDGAFNRIWRVARPRRFLERLLVYWALLTVGPLLLGSMVFFAYEFVSWSLGLIDERDVRRPLLGLVSFAFTTAGLVFLYVIAPNRRVLWRDALAGGAVAGLAFEGLKAGFAYFVAKFGSYKLVYGAFAGFPVFLIWVYLSWLVVLSGAVITAAIPQLRTAAWFREWVPGALYVEALALLRELRARHLDGREPAALAALAVIARATLDDTEGILQRMADRRWVARREGDTWAMARDPRMITLADVYDEFAFRSLVVERYALRLGLPAAIGPGPETVDDWCAAQPGPEAPR